MDGSRVLFSSDDGDEHLRAVLSFCQGTWVSLLSMLRIDIVFGVFSGTKRRCAAVHCKGTGDVLSMTFADTCRHGTRPMK